MYTRRYSPLPKINKYFNSLMKIMKFEAPHLNRISGTKINKSSQLKTE